MRNYSEQFSKESAQKQMIKKEIEKRTGIFLTELIGPQAEIKETLSSGEQIFYGYIVDYLMALVPEAGLELDLFLEKIDILWKECEPEFRQLYKERNFFVLDPNDFTLKVKPLNDSVVIFDLDVIDAALKDAIRVAINQTLDIVGKHEWLNHEVKSVKGRVGHFVTNIRRELNTLRLSAPDTIKDDNSASSLRDFLSRFYNSDYWRDVGVPYFHKTSWSHLGRDMWLFSCTHNGKVWKMDSNKIASLCEQAKGLSSDHEASKAIDDSLAILQRDMYPLKCSLDKLKRINSESEEILGKLCSIIEEK